MFHRDDTSDSEYALMESSMHVHVVRYSLMIEDGSSMRQSILASLHLVSHLSSLV